MYALPQHKAEGFGGWLITPLYASLQVRRQSERSYRAHRKICQALKKRDPDLAEQCMRTHLGEMRNMYMVDVMDQTAPVLTTGNEPSFPHRQMPGE